MTDDLLRRLAIEPHEDGWALVAGDEVVAITTDRAEAEAIAERTQARGNQMRRGDELRMR